MSALICGSFAYDTIMVFHDRFKNHILPDKVHILNVAFHVPDMRREFGGCAANIAYNLKLLGGDPLPMGTVGTDFAPYAAWMDQHGIPRTHVTEVEGTYTAQAFITTDLDDNQITAFHPGAMNNSHENSVSRDLGAGLAIIGPDGKEGMIEHARQCHALGVPFIFDPGQGLPMFSRAELETFLGQAAYVAVNDYEGKMLEEKTGRSLDDIARGLKGLVCTLGANGSVVLAGGQRHEIPSVTPEAVVDPTGCGDAYRAGLLYGLAQLLQTEGLRTTSASVSGFLTGMYVVFTPLLGAVMLRARVGRTTWAAVSLATVGLGVLSLQGVAIGSGEALTLASAVLYAAHIVGTGRASRPGNALGLTVVQLWTVAAVCLVGAVPGGVAVPSTGGDLAVLLYMALVAGAAALVVQTWAQSHLTAERAAIIMTMEPVFAGGFAVAFGGEVLGPRVLVGGALVLAAMYLVELGPRAPQDQDVAAEVGGVPHVGPV